MERILIFIKHHLKPLWKIIDSINTGLFRITYKTRMESIQSTVLGSIENEEYVFRRLLLSDMGSLFSLISDQPEEDLRYFSPHGFDLKSLEIHNRKPTFLMMGAFRGEKMIGYFFLRFFANRKCFVGRLIDKEHRGKGMGKIMNYSMYEIAWQMNFRCLSTVSRDNLAVIRAHSRNKSMIVLKELRNNYLLIEFVRES
jgi:RimJ/RimL family protein N-acetyltransferase